MQSQLGKFRRVNRVYIEGRRFLDFVVEFYVIKLIIVVFEEFEHPNCVDDYDLLHNDLESIQVYKACA